MHTEDVGVFEAKTHLSKLLDKVQTGHIYYITKRGKRVAELRPVSFSGRKRQSGTLKGKIWVAPDFDEPLEVFKPYMK